MRFKLPGRAGRFQGAQGGLEPQLSPRPLPQALRPRPGANRAGGEGRWERPLSPPPPANALPVAERPADHRPAPWVPGRLLRPTHVDQTPMHMCTGLAGASSLPSPPWEGVAHAPKPPPPPHGAVRPPGTPPVSATGAPGPAIDPVSSRHWRKRARMGPSDPCPVASPLPHAAGLLCSEGSGCAASQSSRPRVPCPRRPACSSHLADRTQQK